MWGFEFGVANKDGHRVTGLDSGVCLRSVCAGPWSAARNDDSNRSRLTFEGNARADARSRTQHKHLRLDPIKLKRAQKALEAGSQTEAAMCCFNSSIETSNMARELPPVPERILETRGAVAIEPVGERTDHSRIFAAVSP